MYLEMHEISLLFFLRRYEFFFKKNVWITKIFYLMSTFFLKLIRAHEHMHEIYLRNENKYFSFLFIECMMHTWNVFL